MKAKDVMTMEVFSVATNTPVEEIAALLLSHGISGVPVTNKEGVVVGIISEGDLMRRPEIGTAGGRRAGSWLALFSRASAKSTASPGPDGTRTAGSF